MSRDIDDCVKRRLTERSQIDYAIRFMQRRGISLDDVPEQLTRYYFVDIDEMNAVLKDMATAAAPVTRANGAKASQMPATVRKVA